MKNDRINTISKSNLKKVSKFQWFSLILITGTIFSAIGYQLLISTPNDYDHSLTMPDNMPSRTDSSIMLKENIDKAYEFAQAHPEVLKMVNCYCGCMSSLKHQNNYDCFWTATGEYEPHASDCFTCVHIALSSKTLFEASWPISEISNYIDTIY